MAVARKPIENREPEDGVPAGGPIDSRALQCGEGNHLLTALSEIDRGKGGREARERGIFRLGLTEFFLGLVEQTDVVRQTIRELDHVVECMEATRFRKMWIQFECPFEVLLAAYD